MPKRICIVNQDKLVSEPFAREIKRIFRDTLDVTNYSMDELFTLDEAVIRKFPLFVVSGQDLKKRIQARFGAGVNVTVAQLILATTNIEELLKIKDGSDVAVAMALEENTLDTIRLLKDMGFTNFNYHAYWPGKEEFPAKVDVAITAGGPHHVAGRVKKIINLGPRRLNLSTIFEIISQLGLPLEPVNEVSKDYITEFISLSINLSSYSRQLAEIKTFLSDILNNVTSGIIALDTAGNIKFVNSQATAILNKNIQVGESLTVLPINVEHLKTGLRLKTAIRNKVEVINGERFSIDLLPVSADGIEDLGALLVLRSVSWIQESEKRVRAQLWNKGFFAKYTFKDILSENPTIKESIAIAKKIATSDLGILLFGESGVGKDVFAQAIHNFSPRKNKPFLAINFAGLPANLVESELFGYDEGAFTGARKGGRVGLFEQAHGGTLFLDEIGDASLDIQVRLLRFLEEKRIIRVGGSESIPVDVRIVAATNKVLADLVSQGKFREDLYYRLNVAPITIPPLRERKDDIPLLIEKILVDSNFSVTLEDKLVAFLKEHPWPGNIRQLKNVLNYLLTVHKEKKVITLDDARFVLQTIENTTKNRPAAIIPAGTAAGFAALAPVSAAAIYKQILEEISANPNIGRYTIFTNLAKKGLATSEYKIRKALKQLADQGCVVLGKTKQGTLLTTKGRLLLES